VDVAQRWGSIETMSPRETVWANQLYGDCSAKITCRYIAGITSSDRIKFGDRVFNLAGPPIDVDQLKTITVCYCREQFTDAGSTIEVLNFLQENGGEILEE